MAYATDTYVIKGMRQDDSDLLFNGNGEDKSFAFENYNMRFLPDKSTTLIVAKQEKGNRPVNVMFTDIFFKNPLEVHQTAVYSDQSPNNNRLPFRVIGQCVIDKYLVVFGKCLQTITLSSVMPGTQGSITFTSGNDVIVRFELFSGDMFGWVIYNDDKLNFHTEMPLETLPHIETDIVKKVYFTDGVNGPRSVNVINPEAGLLPNINLGFSLQLDDVFTVTRENNVPGNFPMGKIRFFYTYYNDNYSETPIVDWSPYFDCALDNQGGAQDEIQTTSYAFRVNINNADMSYKFVRVYFMHFTSNDPAVYAMRYIEKPVISQSLSFVVRYDEPDAKMTDRTYLDIKSTGYSFIPYTLAEKDGRMFYGNIRLSLPDISDVNFENTASIVFKDKLVGYENLEQIDTYKYESNRTTFNGSNYEYMGFRKDNWYRFGIIAQHQSGQWSDVLFIADARCNISSRTEVEYQTSYSQTPSGGNSSIPVSEKPVRSKFYIPKARIAPSQGFFTEMQKLYDAGFRRIKPVCVVPPPGSRDVITQGLSCPTLYTGKDRRNILTTNSGLFAFPSHFFRPLPLFNNVGYQIEDGYRLKADYPYTIRDVNDLKIPQNIKITGQDGGWLLNPPFTNDAYANYNPVFREWRHGYSMPPKDRINAEFQSSDFSIHDYRYMRNNAVSRLFQNGESVDLFAFYTSGDNDDMLFKNIYGDDNYIIDTGQTNWRYQLIGQYGALPWHSLHTSGYDNTIFVDESICTLNTPEIDYDFSSQVEPWLTGCNIEIAGYAQVTGSMANVSIEDKQFVKTYANNESLLSNDCDGSFVADGTCLHDMHVRHTDNLDQDTNSYLSTLSATPNIPSSPFLPLCGPWWLDTMLVASLRHDSAGERVDNNLTQLRVLLDHRQIRYSQNYFDDFNTFYNIGNSSLVDKQTFMFFRRAFSLPTVPIPSQGSVILTSPVRAVFKWTPSFYGETRKTLPQNGNVSAEGAATYPHIPSGTLSNTGRIAIFSEFSLTLPVFLPGAQGQALDGDSLAEWVSNWINIPMTWNTIKLSSGTDNDIYWDNWEINRRHINLNPPDFNIPNGVVTIPFDSSIMSQIIDPEHALFWHDYRGTFTYYFNPFLATFATGFYQIANHQQNQSEYRRINHPFILPHNVDPLLPQTRNWIGNGNSSLPVGSVYADAEQIDENTYYFNGSEYGCHYYAPCSTNFTGCYFDPYYAHVVYPFMTTEMSYPFCGSHDVYKAAQGDTDCRPAYNSTNSCLYSSCTNYVNVQHDFNGIITYNSYYHAPSISQELRPEPDLSNIPFVDPDQSGVTHLYSYRMSDMASGGNIPLVSHKTYTLTAAMKWYRGFKSLYSRDNDFDDTAKLICTGNNIGKDSIMGNLFFSGYLPQFFTHCGLLYENNGSQQHVNYWIRTAVQQNEYTYYSDLDRGIAWNDALDDFIKNDYLKTLNIKFQPTPHIVYCNYPTASSQYAGTLHLQPSFYSASPLFDFTDNSNNNVNFIPQYYWKEFVNEIYPAADITAPYHIKGALDWMRATYPHCGHFEAFNFNSLQRASDGQPFWNINGSVFPNYPASTSRRNIDINFSTDKLICRDSNGAFRRNRDYWLLPISNMYNTPLINLYGSDNPYTYNNVSSEYWDWKMCGYTVKISDLLNTNNPNRVDVEYLEGDTYFQRYNCFKTISDDVMKKYLEPGEGEDPVTEGINDVTETASVMIESYINIDGAYWDYNNLVDRKTSVLTHPFWSTMKLINMVYSIQDSLCDTFKQIDFNYYNAELRHYPTMIMWSVQKHDGEVEDSFGIVPVGNRMLASGECGAINMLLNYGDKVFSLQEHGLSILNWNAQVIQPTTTDSTLSMYLSDSTRLNDVVYVSRTTGTQNKWSVAVGHRGFYWMDETLHNISGYVANDGGSGIVDITSTCGFKSWALSNITAGNCLWDADVFPDGRRAFKSNVDTESGDIYWMDGSSCICYNEQLSCFTSFYGYEKTPYKFNWLGKIWSLVSDSRLDTSSSAWEDQCNYTHTLYGNDTNAYIEILSNPQGVYDKVFNFIEYNAEAYYIWSDQIIENFNPWTHISVSNMYQKGDDSLSKLNTKVRFRLWRTSVPRQKLDGVGTLNRIRGPWCKIRLSHIGHEGHSPLTSPNEYSDELYYINVNYTFPEQPQKTNIRQ